MCTPTPTPTPEAMALQTMALRKVYALSLYAVDCLRFCLDNADEAVRQTFLAAAMATLADMQDCIQGVFQNGKTLTD